jgi:hypothetical protein
MASSVTGISLMVSMTDSFTIMALLLDCAALAWLRVNLKKWYKQRRNPECRYPIRGPHENRGSVQLSQRNSAGC